MTLYLVAGPPAAGKTTWVSGRVKPGDVVIDYDRIANSFNVIDTFDHPKHIRALTRAARQAAIEQAVAQRDERDVYLIHALPDSGMLEQYAALGAEFVVIDPGREVVTERVESQRPQHMLNAVNEWYDSVRDLPALQQDSAPKWSHNNNSETLTRGIPLSDTETQDTPVTVTPSPLDMPGARKEPLVPVVEAEPKPEPKKAETVEPQQDSLTSEEREELERLRNFRKQSRDWEKTAKQNYEDAQRFRKLSEQFGTSEEGDPDPLAEVNKLRSEIENERRERVRERIARETGVPPTQITGSDEDSMRESAAQALSWAQEYVKQAGVPLAAPSTNVNSDGKPHDERAGQIKSRDDLKSMTPSEITEAYREGRLDYLMGKQT